MNKQLIKMAVEAALGAGKILLEGFGNVREISNKEGKNNIVTEYDKKSENFIIDFIAKKFPEHIFLAEESGCTGELQPDKTRWIIDPLDGTVNYAHNLPIFSVSIAAELNGEILCGVVYDPTLGNLFTAEKGKGAFLNNAPIRVSRTSNINSAFLVTGFPYNVSQNPCGCIDLFVSIIRSGIPVRRLGSAALDLAYIASGKFDGFWEIELHPWDVAAGILMVSEAGGMVTRFDNQPYNLFSDTMLATNGLIHEQIVELLNGCK